MPYRRFGRRAPVKGIATAEEIAARLAKLAEKSEKGLIAKEVGECQACGSKQKLEPNRTLVFHGYRRPGTGQTHGTCPGVGYPPYELSCELVKALKLGQEETRASLLDQAEKARRGETESFHAETRKGFVKIDRSDPDFARKLAYHAQGLEHRARGAADMARYYGERAARWQPKPIESVIEAERKKLAATAETRAAKDTKRMERLAKVAAKDAKKADLEARRKVIMDGYRERARILAAEEASPTRATASMKLWNEITAKKNSWLWVHELGIDKELVELGLAERHPDQRIFYKYR